MSAEVHIMCDVCGKTIYRGDTPGHANHRTEEVPPDAPRSVKSKLLPMHADPPPGYEHGAVQLTGNLQQVVKQVQTCSRECTRKAVNEIVDWVFQDQTNDGYNLHQIRISFVSR